MTHQCLNFKVLEVKEKMCITSYSLKFKDRWLGAYVDHNMPSPSMIYTKFVFHLWCHSSCAYSWHAIGRCTWSHVSRQHLNAPLLDYHKAMLPNQPWGHCTNFPRFVDTSKNVFTCQLSYSYLTVGNTAELRQHLLNMGMWSNYRGILSNMRQGGIAMAIAVFFRSRHYRNIGLLVKHYINIWQVSAQHSCMRFK